MCTCHSYSSCFTSTIYEDDRGRCVDRISPGIMRNDTKAKHLNRCHFGIRGQVPHMDPGDIWISPVLSIINLQCVRSPAYGPGVSLSHCVTQHNENSDSTSLRNCALYWWSTNCFPAHTYNCLCNLRTPFYMIPPRSFKELRALL